VRGISRYYTAIFSLYTPFDYGELIKEGGDGGGGVMAISLYFKDYIVI